MSKGYTGRLGPGVTAKEIKIGIVLLKVGTIGDQFGIKASYGDGEKRATARDRQHQQPGGLRPRPPRVG